MRPIGSHPHLHVSAQIRNANPLASTQTRVKDFVMVVNRRKPISRQMQSNAPSLGQSHQPDAKRHRAKAQKPPGFRR